MRKQLAFLGLVWFGLLAGFWLHAANSLLLPEANAADVRVLCSAGMSIGVDEESEVPSNSPFRTKPKSKARFVSYKAELTLYRLVNAHESAEPALASRDNSLLYPPERSLMRRAIKRYLYRLIPNAPPLTA